MKKEERRKKKEERRKKKEERRKKKEEKGNVPSLILKLDDL
jgi:hypothetical protein